MATPKQIAANQENARASTGPKSAGGLSRSSKNATRHGLTAGEVTIFDEAADRFDQLRDAYFDALQPVGAIETQLVNQMVIASWRLNRVYRIEAQMIRSEMEEQTQKVSDPLVDFIQNGNLANLNESPKLPKNNLGTIFRKLSDERDRFFPLLRYEITAERSFYRALHNLERLQERRLGKPVSAPHVLIGDLSKDNE